MPDWKWALRPTFEGLTRAIQQMACGITVEDDQGILLYVNERILEWSGYTVPELEGKPVAMLVPEELRNDLEGERKRVLEGDQRVRLSAFERRDGRTFPVAVAPQAMKRADDGSTGIMALLFDLAEVQTARPLGARPGSLAAELSGVAMKLQSMSFSAGLSKEGSTPIDHPKLKDLSAREREILQLLVSGSRVPSMAKELFISPNTVRNHLKAIYRKVEVSSQSELIDFVRALTRAGDDQDQDEG